MGQEAGERAIVASLEGLFQAPPADAEAQDGGIFGPTRPLWDCIDPSHPSDPKSTEDNTDNLMAQLTGHFDNRASAAMNSDAAPEQLAAAMMDQYAKIKAALDALSATSRNKPAPTPATRSRTVPPPPQQEAQV